MFAQIYTCIYVYMYICIPFLSPSYWKKTSFSQQIQAKATNLRHNDSSEWADVQKGAFTDWINSTLRERGIRVQEDLFEGGIVCRNDGRSTRTRLASHTPASAALILHERLDHPRAC